MNENDSLAGGDFIPVSILSFFHFTMKKCSIFNVKQYKFVLKLQSGRVC